MDILLTGVYKDDKIVEFKSLRSPVSEDKKIEFQNEYDKLRKKEEGTCRIVTNISVDNYEKLKKLAKEENISEKKILDFILSDSLF